jgi:hypothetical protein
MKTLIFATTCALVAAGCLATYTPGSSQGDVDMAQAGTGGNGGSGGGGGGGAGGGGGMNAGGDMARAAGDMAGNGQAAFGATCSVAGDCQSGLCEPFVMGAVHRCTKTCTVATQATDCPAPSAGTCTNNGYCKFAN